MFNDPNLLIGADLFSDAGVYRIDEQTAIVQSLDFFPPLVNDPFIYGQIAAANSMSDVFAMGGRVKTALNIVSFPDDDLGMVVLGEILKGGAERVKAAGGVIVGGHSVRDPGVQYGLSVTGVVDPARMMTNRAATPGDMLILTKPLGTGFITTALRARKCPDEVIETACTSMFALNQKPSELAVEHGVKAATDITGFGLAGHAFEMAEASNVSIHLKLDDLPILPGALDLAGKGNLTRANATNRDHVAPALELNGVDHHPHLEFLFDPQTSGGLLLATPPDQAESLLKQIRVAGFNQAAVVGEVHPPDDDRLVIHL